MSEAASLTKIGSTSSGKEATKQDSSIVRFLASNCCTSEPFKDTQEEKWLHLRCWANSSYLTIGKVFVLHRGCSFNLTSILNAGVIAGGREGREARHTSVLHTYWTHGVLKRKKSIAILRDPENFTAKQDGSTLKTLFIGFISGEHKRKA